MEKLLINDELIAEAISKTTKDQYGQIIKANCMPSQLFPDKEIRDLIIQHIKSGESKYSLYTYGWTHGSYKAISLNLFK